MQLLSLTIEIEKPELEQQKSLVLREEEQLKVQLAELEAALLTELASSQGNLLENKALLVSLDQTKESSTLISKKLVESKELQGSLDGQRDVYRPLAGAGADMFFILKARAARESRACLCLTQRHFVLTTRGIAPPPPCRAWSG